MWWDDESLKHMRGFEWSLRYDWKYIINIFITCGEYKIFIIHWTAYFIHVGGCTERDLFYLFTTVPPYHG